MIDRSFDDFTNSDAVKTLATRIKTLERQIREKDATITDLSRIMIEKEFNRNTGGGEVERAVLATDIAGFSKLNNLKRGQATTLLDRVGAIVFDEHNVEYGNDWGDALVGVFETPEVALTAGLRLIRLMDVDGFKIRVGASFGPLKRVRKHVQNRISFEGFPLIEAARLEPMALPGELIASPSLIYSGALTFDRFAILREQRAWTKPHGTVNAGDLTNVFVVSEQMDR